MKQNFIPVVTILIRTSLEESSLTPFISVQLSYEFQIITPVEINASKCHLSMFPHSRIEKIISNPHKLIIHHNQQHYYLSLLDTKRKNNILRSGKIKKYIAEVDY